MSLNLDCPRTLPVGHLSHSSISTYLGCPERWRRRYLDLEYEPSTPKQIVGTVVGRSVTAGYLDKMEHGHVNQELLEDTFSSEWDGVDADSVVWGDEVPGTVKDSAVDSLRAYSIELMPYVSPITVEEGFELWLPECEWATIGFMDIRDSVALYDVKTSMKARTQAALDSDMQATLYVAAKQSQPDSDGVLMPFRWHAIKRPSPAGRNPAVAIELRTERTQVQVNNYLERIAAVAREIDWRVETGNWQGAAPGYWLCGAKQCGYWDTCPFGGKR